MAALCTVCSNSDDSVEFATVGELLAHTKGGHVSRPEKNLPPPRKPVTPSATELKAQEENKTKVITTPAGQVIEYPKESPPVIQRPLELHYKWTGVHAPCGSEPKTIEANLGESVMAVAYCMNCDKQLEQMNVPAIPADKSKK